MKTHQEIDRRGLYLAYAVADRIDADPERKGLKHAQEVCARWIKNGGSKAAIEWQALLQRPWIEVKAMLLLDTEEGKRLRQNTPFCGIFTPQERWTLLKKERLRNAAQPA
jgi:hypothetical protein